MEENLMTSNDVASFLGVQRKFVYKLVKDGRLRCYYVGRHIRFSREQVDEYLASVEGQSDGQD